MQARRHAAVLAGHLLADDLAALRYAGNVAELRGLASVEREWAVRGKAAGRAATFDCGLDLPGSPALDLACQQVGVATGPWSAGVDGRPAVTLAVERALMIALVCARHLGRYEWTGALRTEPVLAAATWDCLPQPAADTPAVLTCQVAAASGTHAAAPSPGNPR
jgi:hypothetical protein